MDVDLINGLHYTEIFGRGRVECEMRRRMPSVTFHRIEHSNSFNIPWIRTFPKFVLYPVRVKRTAGNDHVKHITTQEYGFIRDMIALNRTVITCHDLIPWVLCGDHSRYWKANLSGLKKADMISTVSEFSKSDILKTVGCPPEKVRVIHNAVDHAAFFPKREKTVLRAYGIEDDAEIILYVGSEQKRKNLFRLLHAFQALKEKIPGVKLLKIGRSQAPQERSVLLQCVQSLNLARDVILIDYVAEADLPKFYNAADLFVFPSLYEGFGLPPLEAMACGTPVVASNVTSIPEVVGDAGILVDPYEVGLLADAMYDVLRDESLRTELIQKGLQRSKRFNWDRSAAALFQLYQELERS